MVVLVGCVASAPPRSIEQTGPTGAVRQAINPPALTQAPPSDDAALHVLQVKLTQMRQELDLANAAPIAPLYPNPLPDIADLKDADKPNNPVMVEAPEPQAYPVPPAAVPSPSAHVPPSAKPATAKPAPAVPISPSIKTAGNQWQIHFGPASSSLNLSDALKKDLIALAKNAHRIKITGFSVTGANTMANEKLAQARAMALRDYLVTHDVASRKIEVISQLLSVQAHSDADTAGKRLTVAFD